MSSANVSPSNSGLSLAVSEKAENHETSGALLPTSRSVLTGVGTSALGKEGGSALDVSLNLWCRALIPLPPRVIARSEQGEATAVLLLSVRSM